jgi:lysophospholipase L1-like esterase
MKAAPTRAFLRRAVGWLAACVPLTVTAQDPQRFEPDIAAFERADAAKPPPLRPVLFAGSSSLRLWPELPGVFPGYPVLNRGFGGSHMTDLLHYFDRVVKRYEPAVVVVYEGDNDLAAEKPAGQVYTDCTRFVARVRLELPGTDVIFIAVKPSPNRAKYLEAQRDLNDRLRRLAEQDARVSFVDVFTPMLGADGQPRPELFQADQLHLNAAGYELWRERVGAALAAWSAQKANPHKAAGD